MGITLSLTVDEINGILQLLGNAPTSSGIWPVLIKIKEQAELQITKGTEKEG